MTEEEWRPIKGYEGLYEVSSFGRVKGLDRYVKSCYDSYRLQKGKVLSPVINYKGYLSVGLQGRRFMIHRLVAQAFIPNPDNLPEVNHKDEVKTNNNIDNLEWCDAKYNNNYGTRKDRIRDTAIKKGYWSGLSKEEYKKKYNQDHKEHIKEYKKKYNQDHKEHIKEYKKKWYQENKEKILIQTKEYKRKRKAGL